MNSGFFDASVGTYLQAAHSRNFQARERVFAAAARLAASRADDLVCVDLGVGTGYLSRVFASYGFHVVGCDTSAEMLKVAAESVPGAELKLADVVEFLADVPPDSADLITCSSVLEYLPDPLAVVRLAAPALRRNGVLAVSLPLRFSISRFLQSALMLRKPRETRYASQWRNHVSGQELVAEAERVGLRLVSRELFGSFEWRKLRLPLEQHSPVATLALYVFEPTDAG